ncbi:hypothetical protein HLBS07_02090 [Vibrio alginolyticus]|nr:hypothetical protein HLBS07_02090 [Vibrio alginolyticus]
MKNTALAILMALSASTAFAAEEAGSAGASICVCNWYNCSSGRCSSSSNCSSGCSVRQRFNVYFYFYLYFSN